MPPMFYRNFGLSFNSDSDASTHQTGKSKQEWRCTDGGIGLSVGKLLLEDGSYIEGGRLLMKDQWNTELHGALADAYHEGSRLAPADERFHKATHSGFWGGNTDFARYIKDEGIKTLLFAGVNTDQCVLATMQDAAQQGYDTIMLKDACGTVSPPFAQRMVEFNAHKAFGFQSSCDDFLYGVEHIVDFRSKPEL